MSLAPGQYWRQVVTVLSGAVASQLLPFLAAPVITRMCSPAQMGSFSVWMGIVSIAAVGATLRLDTAMIIDRDRDAQRHCFSIVAYVASLLALCLTLFGVLAWWFALPLGGTIGLFGWLTIGAGTWLSAYMQVTLAYATGRNAFGKASTAKVFGSAAIVAVQLALLALGARAVGLVAGQLVGLAAGLVAARHLLAPPRPRLSPWPSDAQRRYLRKHQAFWRLALPADLLGALVAQLPLLLIGARYGIAAAGLFGLTQRMMAAPISLVAASVLEVFKLQSVLEFERHGHCSRAYAHSCKVLVLLGIIPSVFMCVFAPVVFAWLFGAAWRSAGEFAQLMAPLYFLNFVASPLSYVFYVVGKQKLELVWQISKCTMTLAVFLSPLSLVHSIMAYTAGHCGLYLLYLHASYRYAQPQVISVPLHEKS
jgi:O-antigen/teichoic acid export membrane protein